MENATKPTAQETFDKIQAWLASGKTVFVATALRTTKITPKTAAKWKANGHTLFKVSGSSLYMAAGNRFDCIDFCHITAN